MIRSVQITASAASASDRILAGATYVSSQVCNISALNAAQSMMNGGPLVATAFDEHGNSIAGISFRWESSNPAVCSVVPDSPSSTANVFRKVLAPTQNFTYTNNGTPSSTGMEIGGLSTIYAFAGTTGIYGSTRIAVTGQGWSGYKVAVQYPNPFTPSTNLVS
jgi:hypothetical protein